MLLRSKINDILIWSEKYENGLDINSYDQNTLKRMDLKQFYCIRINDVT